MKLSVATTARREIAHKPKQKRFWENSLAKLSGATPAGFFFLDVAAANVPLRENAPFASAFAQGYGGTSPL
ncbi:MAG: hypothetical protein IJW33_07050, partial [Lentisphaeria bacterium]|nr:hypothetical protein [Lentisphaeria bacterium]